MTTQQKTAVAERTRDWVPIGETEPIKMSLSIAKKYFANPTRKGHRPTDEMVMSYMMMMAARKLNPWVGDAWIIGYDGKDGPEFSIVTAYQALAKRAELHPAYDGIEWGIILEVDGKIEEREGAFHGPDERLVGAWAKVYRKDRSRPFVAKIQRAPYDKGFSQWKINPAWMLGKCARTAAMREAFPLELGGMYVEEEMAAERRISGGDIIDVAATEPAKVTMDDLTKPPEGDKAQADKVIAELKLDLRRTTTIDDVQRCRDSYLSRVNDQDLEDRIELAAIQRIRDIEDMQQTASGDGELFDHDEYSDEAAADV